MRLLYCIATTDRRARARMGCLKGRPNRQRYTTVDDPCSADNNIIMYIRIVPTLAAMEIQFSEPLRNTKATYRNCATIPYYNNVQHNCQFYPATMDKIVIDNHCGVLNFVSVLHNAGRHAIPFARASCAMSSTDPPQ